jgi:hypothetical protein
MSNDTYLAVFLGSKTSPKMVGWNALFDAERQKKEREGIATWKASVEKHQGAILEMSGPLGKSKKVDAKGVADIANGLGAFTVVRAASHEAAANSRSRPQAESEPSVLRCTGGRKIQRSCYLLTLIAPLRCAGIPQICRRAQAGLLLRSE